MAEEKISILLAEDDTLLRRSLAELLQLEPDFRLAGQVSSGAQAVTEAERTKPNVVLMDIQMPQMDGIEATRRIKASRPETEVVILTKFGDDDKVFAAIKAGAIGYLLKDAGLEEIRASIRAAHQREGSLSPSLVARVLKEFGRLTHAAEENRALFAELTRREVEVLELLGMGLRNRSIAERLFLSEKTVRNHVSSIFQKLQINDRTEAALLAQKHGLGR
jgi:two-component system, NarL family, response regulator LiaR